MSVPPCPRGAAEVLLPARAAGRLEYNLAVQSARSTKLSVPSPLSPLCQL
jgi:hypothetical protein